LSEYGMGFAGGMAPQLRELFGVAQLRLRNVRPPRDFARWRMEERSFGDSVDFRELAGTGDLAGSRLSPVYYLQTFRPLSAKPILLDGDEPAGVRNRYGRGSAWLIGTLLGHAVTAFPDSGNAALLSAVAATAGVSADRAGRLLRRRRTAGGKTAWFLFNAGTEAVEESLSVAGFRQVSDLLGGELQRDGNTVRVALQPLDVRCLVLSS
jgi:beta-galactosidase